MCDDRTQNLRDQLTASNNEVQTAKLEALIIKNCGCGHHSSCGCGRGSNGNGNGNGNNS